MLPVYDNTFALPIEKHYRPFAKQAVDFIIRERSQLMHFNSPRHYLVHYFKPSKSNGRKILITHGWMSRAAYMARLIHALRQEGYEVYALDFPAHGEARGFQLTWLEAIRILRQIISDLGEFYALIGHSFGGSMIYNMLNLAHQYAEWELPSLPKQVILLASPFCMRVPVKRAARQLGLSGQAYLNLRNLFKQGSNIDLKHLHYRYLINHCNIPFFMYTRRTRSNHSTS